MTALLLNRRHLLLGAAGLLCGIRAASAHNGTVHVTIENLAFTPADVKAKVGEIIEWTNKDPFDHTATVDGKWDIMIPAGQVVTHVVEAGDSVEYYCRFHPNMKGRISVLS